MRKFLLYSSALVLGLSGVVEAACIQTPTCSSLGYTSSSSCTGGVKCPFGNAWNCTASENKTELTNKITELEKQLTEIKRHINSSNCQVGNILYSDFTCSSYVIANKTPIGVVFDIVNNLAVALEQKEKVAWSTTNFDIPALMPYVDYKSDYEGKKNTKAIYDYCKANNKSCPAVEYAYTYKTEGTSEGDWYLPSALELKTLLDTRDTISPLLSQVGVGISLSDLQMKGSTSGIGYVFYYYNYYWSSSSISQSTVKVETILTPRTPADIDRLPHFSAYKEEALSKTVDYDDSFYNLENLYIYTNAYARPILAY